MAKDKNNDTPFDSGDGSNAEMSAKDAAAVGDAIMKQSDASFGMRLSGSKVRVRCVGVTNGSVAHSYGCDDVVDGVALVPGEAVDAGYFSDSSRFQLLDA